MRMFKSFLKYIYADRFAVAIRLKTTATWDIIVYDSISDKAWITSTLSRGIILK